MLIEALRITKNSTGRETLINKADGRERLGAVLISGLERQAHSKSDEFCVRKRMKTHQSAALISREKKASRSTCFYPRLVTCLTWP